MRRTRWILRCRDLFARERFITTSVADGLVHLLVSNDVTVAPVALSTREVSRLRRQLAEAQAEALTELGEFDAS